MAIGYLKPTLELNLGLPLGREEDKTEEVSPSDPTRRLVATMEELAMSAQRDGIDLQEGPRPFITKTGTDTVTGKRVGMLSDGRVINLIRTGTYDDNIKVAQAVDGEIYEIRQSPSPESVRRRQALGIIAGTLNSPFAAWWGYWESAPKYGKRLYDWGVEHGMSPTTANILATGVGWVGGLYGALDSAAKSAFQKGEWGSRFTDAYEAHVGKSFKDHLYDMVKMEQDPAEKSKLKTVYNTVAGLSIDTLELLIEVALEGGVMSAATVGTRAPSIIREILKSGSLREGLGAAGVRRVTDEFIKKSATQVEKELLELLKNRQKLDQVMDIFSRKSTALKINETRDMLVKRINEELRIAGDLQAQSFDAMARVPKDAVENVKRIWTLSPEARYGAREVEAGIEEGLGRVARAMPIEEARVAEPELFGKFGKAIERMGFEAPWEFKARKEFGPAKPEPKEFEKLLKYLQGVEKEGKDLTVAFWDALVREGGEFSDIFKAAKERKITVTLNSTDLDPSALGRYHPKTGNFEIYVETVRRSANEMSQKRPDILLAHEALHGIYDMETRAMPKMQRMAFDTRLDDLREYVKEALVRHRSGTKVLPGMDEAIDLHHNAVGTITDTYISHMLKNNTELIAAAYSDATLANILAKIPFEDVKEVGRVGSIWEKIKEIFTGVVGKATGTSKAKLDEIMQTYMDVQLAGYTRGGKTIEPYRTVSGSLGRVTLESSGLQSVYELIGSGMRRAQGMWDNWKGIAIDEPTGQLDDVLDVVREHLKHQYEPVIRGKWRTANMTTSKIMRDLARQYGWEVSKIEGGYRLRRGNEVVNVLGKNTSHANDKLFQFLSAEFHPKGIQTPFKRGAAREYADDLFQTELKMEAEEGANAWIAHHFPDGLTDVSYEQAMKAARKMIDTTLGGGGWFGKTSRMFEVGSQYFWQGRTVLNRVPSGKQLWDLIAKTVDEGLVASARTWTRLFGEKGLLVNLGVMDKSGKLLVPKQFLEDVRLYLDSDKSGKHFGETREIQRRGKVIKTLPPAVDNPRARAVAQAIRPILDEVYSTAEAVKLPGLQPHRKNYFPHTIPSLETLKKGAKRDEILEATVREGRFVDRAEAEKNLDAYITSIERKQAEPTFIEYLAREMEVSLGEAQRFFEDVILQKYQGHSGHLVKKRLMHVPWYDRDISTALADYIIDINRTFSVYQNLGKDNKRALDLIARIRAEGGNTRVASDLITRLTSPGHFSGLESWQRKLMAFQTITKLNPLTTLINFSQAFATAVRTSPSASLRAITRWDKEFAQRSGAILQQTIRDIMLAHGGASPAGTFYLRSIGFKKSEEILRTLAANAGKYHLEDMVGLLSAGRRVDYAKRQIRSLGLDPDKIMRRGKATEEELLLAGKRVSDETQFRGNMMDLPHHWLGGYGRLVTQFKTFTYNQAHLIKRHVWDEARHGNLRPLMFLLTTYPVVGYGYDKLVNQVLLGKEPPEKIFGPAFDWYWRGLTSIGALGILESSLTAVTWGEKAVLEHLAGPTLSDIANASQVHSIFLGSDGFNEDRFIKEIGGLAPYVGRFIRNRADDLSSRPRKRTLRKTRERKRRRQR